MELLQCNRLTTVVWSRTYQSRPEKETDHITLHILFEPTVSIFETTSLLFVSWLTLKPGLVSYYQFFGNTDLSPCWGQSTFWNELIIPLSFCDDREVNVLIFYFYFFKKNITILLLNSNTLNIHAHKDIFSKDNSTRREQNYWCAIYANHVALDPT